MSEFTVFVINPGSTSTKIALFKNSTKVFSQTLAHEPAELSKFKSNWDQFDFRLDAIEKVLKTELSNVKKLDAVVGRGGLLKPVKRGTFLVNQEMLQDAKKGVQGDHISNTGCALAQKIAEQYGCSAYIVDPVSVDEFEAIARLSGHPLIERKSLSHSLNLRAAAFRAAHEQHVNIQDSCYIVAHLGGGISVAPVLAGRVIDVNDASNAGPFSPERSGTLPLTPLIDLCFSGKYDKREIKSMVMGNGGMKAYLNTSNLIEIESRIENGDEFALLVLQAMAYQIAKEIGAMAAVVRGKINSIILTGGLAKSENLVALISERISFLAPIKIYAGEYEMEAMAEGVLRILNKQEELQQY